MNLHKYWTCRNSNSHITCYNSMYFIEKMALGVALGVALDFWESEKKYQHYFILTSYIETQVSR